MKIKFTIILMINCLLIVGCSILKSTRDDNSLKNKQVYALPKGKVKLKLANNEFSIDAIYEPDQDNYYFLEYCSNIGFDDEVRVTVNNKGLLSGIEVTSKSQVGAIVSKVMEIIKEAVKIGVPAGPAKAFEIIIDPNEIPKDNKNILNIALQLDPLLAKKMVLESDPIANKAELIKVENEINRIREEIEKKKAIIGEKKDYLQYFDYGILYISITRPEKTNLFIAETTSGPTSTGGIIYRPVLPCKIRMLYKNCLFDNTIYLPNWSPPICIDINRPAFVEKVYSLKFQDGVLTEVYLKKPSELLAGLGIPAEVVKTAAGLPLDLLKFRVEYGDQYNKLLQSQINEIKNKQELFELQQKMGR